MSNEEKAMQRIMNAWELWGTGVITEQGYYALIEQIKADNGEKDSIFDYDLESPQALAIAHKLYRL